MSFIYFFPIRISFHKILLAMVNQVFLWIYIQKEAAIYSEKTNLLTDRNKVIYCFQISWHSPEILSYYIILFPLSFLSFFFSFFYDNYIFHSFFVFPSPSFFLLYWMWRSLVTDIQRKTQKKLSAKYCILTDSRKCDKEKWKCFTIVTYAFQNLKALFKESEDLC